MTKYLSYVGSIAIDGLHIRAFALVVFAFALLCSAPARADSRTVDACSIDNPPANCKGLKATSVWYEVPKGAYAHVPDPGCMDDNRDALARTLAAATTAAFPKAALFAGEIGKLAAGPIGDHFRRNGGGDLGRYFSPYAKNAALCAYITVVVPAKAEVVGYRLEMTDNWENWQWRRCTVGADCGQGWCKFAMQPSHTQNESLQVLSVLFMNWSDDRPRVPRVTVFYKYDGLILTEM